MRVGIVGTGFVARRAHIPAWAALPGAHITALCNTHTASLELAARLAPDAALFTDYRALLDSGIDALSICTSNASHFEIALAALEAGKHVLCEKPLGISVAEIQALGAVAEARGVVLMAEHQLRFAGPAQAAKACIAEGKVGEVYHARVRALRSNKAPTLPGFTDSALSGGGAVLDLGVHALDMALWLMGFPKAVRVSGSIRTNFALGERIPGFWGEWDRTRFTVEDFGTGFVHFENGATLSLECAWLGHHDDDGIHCELFGERGNLRWPPAELLSQGASLHREALPVALNGLQNEDPHHTAIRAFYEAVTEGKGSPVPWQEAAASLALIEALYASAHQGREIIL